MRALRARHQVHRAVCEEGKRLGCAGVVRGVWIGGGQGGGDGGGEHAGGGVGTDCAREVARQGTCHDAGAAAEVEEEGARAVVVGEEVLGVERGWVGGTVGGVGVVAEAGCSGRVLAGSARDWRGVACAKVAIFHGRVERGCWNIR